MNKQTIRNILALRKVEGKIKILSEIPTTLRKSTDRVNESVWGVIRKSDWELLKTFWLGKEKLNKEVENECKKIAIKLLKAISSISTGHVQNTIVERFGNCGVALEFFLLDKLIRKNRKNNEISFEKGPLEFDGAKVDFLSKYKTDFGNIIIGNQLTTTESKGINTKHNDVREAGIKLDQQSGWVKDKTFSCSQIPHLPTLFIINSHTSREVNKGIRGNNNILKEAYIKWKERGFKEGGPSLYLDKEIQQELNLISTSYTKIVAEFIKFVQENNLEKPHTYSVEGEEERIVYKYDSENGEFEGSFFKAKKGGEDFIYSVKFYITNKFLRTLKISKEVTRKSNENKKKKKGTPKRKKGNGGFYRPALVSNGKKRN